MRNILSYKPSLCAFVESFLDGWAHETRNKNQWGTDFAGRLRQFTVSGKMLRGGLVCMACEMLDNAPREDAVAVGAALELAQSALLIHDDIMDQVPTRRGNPGIHAQYEAHARSLDLRHPRRFGESMGICAGDIAFFLSFDILAGLPHTSADVRLRLIKTFNRELVQVGLAQMEDVFHEVWKGEPSREEIMEQYRHKTARYTFSLPLLLGGMLAGAPTATRDQLARLGEAMGVLFQIVDDGLDIFRTTGQIGKTAAADIMSNKKTLHRLALFEACNPEQKKRLEAIFGNSTISPVQLRELRGLFEQSGALESIEALKRQLTSEASTIIGGLEIEESGKQSLLHLLDYLVGRER